MEAGSTNDYGPHPNHFDWIILKPNASWSNTLSNLEPGATYTFDMNYSADSPHGDAPGGNLGMTIDSTNVFSYLFIKPDGHGGPGHKSSFDWVATNTRSTLNMTNSAFGQSDITMFAHFQVTFKAYPPHPTLKPDHFDWIKLNNGSTWTDNIYGLDPGTTYIFSVHCGASASPGKEGGGGMNFFIDGQNAGYQIVGPPYPFYGYNFSKELVAQHSYVVLKMDFQSYGSTDVGVVAGVKVAAKTF